MNRIYLSSIILGVMLLTTPVIAQEKWEAGIGFIHQSYSRGEIAITDPIDIYNFAAHQSGGKLLTPYVDRGKSTNALTLWGKYRLHDGESPLALGVEVVLNGLNISVFGEYQTQTFEPNESKFGITARPRVSIGWNASFPLQIDWNAYLAQQLPSLSAEEIDTGADALGKVSPSSVGIPLSVNVSPQIDVEYDPFDSEMLRLRGSLRYSWDVMTLLSKRSQNGFGITLGVVARFGG